MCVSLALRTFIRLPRTSGVFTLFVSFSWFSRQCTVRTPCILRTEDLHSQLPPQLQKAVDLAQEEGAPTWLTALPLKDHGFALHRAALHDAMALRYGSPP